MEKQDVLERFNENRKKNAELEALLDKQYLPQDAAEIKRLIATYFWNKLSSEMDQIAKEKGWTQETYNQWANEHFRTPYEPA